MAAPTHDPNNRHGDNWWLEDIAASLAGGVGGGGALSTAAKGSTTAGSPTSTAASANRQPLDVTIYDASGNPISSFGSSSTSNAVVAATVLQNAATAVGNGSTINCTGMTTLLLVVSGITNATIIVEGVDPSGNYTAIRVKLAGTNTISTSITTDGVYEVNVAGFGLVRARISAYTSGTITATAGATAAPNKAGVQSTSWNERLDPNNDATSEYEKMWTPINLTASGQILSSAGAIKGFFVNSTTAGTVRVADNTTSGSGYTGAAITPAAGSFYAYPALLNTGGYITITGTIDVTFFVRLGATA